MLDKKVERMVDGWNWFTVEFISWLYYLYLQDLLPGFA
jgi:hypothetical protein